MIIIPCHPQPKPWLRVYGAINPALIFRDPRQVALIPFAAFAIDTFAPTLPFNFTSASIYIAQQPLSPYSDHRIYCVSHIVSIRSLIR